MELDLGDNLGGKDSPFYVAIGIEDLSHETLRRAASEAP